MATLRSLAGSLAVLGAVLAGIHQPTRDRAETLSAVMHSATMRNLTRSSRRAARCSKLTPQEVEDLNDATDPAPCLEVR